jgi:hypothetical protein
LRPCGINSQSGTVGVDSQGQINAVVHQEQGVVAGAELAKTLSLLEPAPVVEAAALLGPVLHQAHSGRQSMLHHPFQVRHRRGDQIETTCLEPAPQILATTGAVLRAPMQGIKAGTQ